MPTRSLLLAVACLACAETQHPAQGDAAAQLKALSERYWTLTLSSAPLQWVGDEAAGPVYATSLGDHRFDAQLDDLSSAGRAKELAEIAAMAEEARAIPESALTGEDRLTRALLLDTLEQTQAIQVCDVDRWTVDQMYGPQDTLPLTAMYYPLETDEGLANLLARFSQVGRYLDQQMASLEEGRAKGEVSPKQNVKLVIAQIDALLAKDGAHSDFQPPPEKLEKLSSERRALVTSKIAESLTRDVLPPLRKYRTYLSDKLLPVARVEPGLSALPQGAACYAATIRNHTGLPLTPKELHEMGLNLLAGIEKEEEAIAIAEGAKLRPDGHPDLKAFEKSVGKRPDQTLKTGEELMAWARRTIDRAMAALPRDFKTLPQRPLIVKAIEPWRADSNGACYQQATDDGQTPALYYIPTTKPETRTLYDQEATVFHEGVPGHHLQVSIGQSLQGLPAFRRNGGSTGYVEGWALYSERLADELKLYSSPVARYGMLSQQALRAVRLVVDTGLHSMHWTRDQALAFYLAHTSDDPEGGASEIDRYIIWPGQALGYMVGEQEIFKLRAEAKDRLGAAFDLRDFHDAVLLHGALPLPVLEQEIHRWIGERLAAAQAK